MFQMNLTPAPTPKIFGGGYYRDITRKGGKALG